MADIKSGNGKTETVNMFEFGAAHALTDDADGSDAFAHLIDGEKTVADHISLCGDKGRENETRTIAKDEIITNMNGLKVFCLSWC